MITIETAKAIAQTEATAEAADYVQLLEAHLLLTEARSQMEAVVDSSDFTPEDAAYLTALRTMVAHVDHAIYVR